MVVAGVKSPRPFGTWGGGPGIERPSYPAGGLAPLDAYAVQVRPHSIKSRSRFLAALVLVPCLAGCFASPGGESSSDGGQPGSRLRVALAFPPAENFSPYGADATLLSRLGVTEGLTALDANGAAAPALAESWRRENDRTWRFTLREATFQDGTDVTPAAVAGALTRATKAKPAPAALAGVTLDAKADGDRGIRVTTAAADPVLPMRLSSPSLAILSPKAYGKKGNPDPVGTATGPFEITKVSGGGSATLDRYDDYWSGRAQASGIDARFVKDGTARANAVRTGDVDIAEAIPVAQAATLDKATLREAGTTRTTGLQLNTRTGPFKDPKLRAAARTAIDSSAIVKGVFEGYADPGAGVYGPAVTWAESKRVKPAGRAEAARPDGERDHPRHLRQPARAPRGRPGGATAAGEGRLHGEARSARVLTAGERRARREVRRVHRRPQQPPGHRRSRRRPRQ